MTRKEAFLMMWPDFKFGWGCQSLPGGFDSHFLRHFLAGPDTS